MYHRHTGHLSPHEAPDASGELVEYLQQFNPGTKECDDAETPYFSTDVVI